MNIRIEISRGPDGLQPAVSISPPEIGVETHSDVHKNICPTALVEAAAAHFRVRGGADEELRRAIMGMGLIVAVAHRLAEPRPINPALAPIQSAVFIGLKWAVEDSRILTPHVISLIEGELLDAIERRVALRREAVDVFLSEYIRLASLIGSTEP